MQDPHASSRRTLQTSSGRNRPRQRGLQAAMFATALVFTALGARGRTCAGQLTSRISGAPAASHAFSPALIAAAPAPFQMLHTDAIPALFDGELGAKTGLDGSSTSESSHSASALPEAPLPVDQDASLQSGRPLPARDGTASRLTKYIRPGMSAPPLSRRDKFDLGIHDLYTPQNFLAILFSAGYSHLANSEPNYGTDKGAFGERLGAAGIRESTQGFFTDSVFAPMLHQDPRYYIEGPRYSFVHRVFYAATRPFLTRNDDGDSTINSSLLLGYAAAAALTPAYYPKDNRSAGDAANTFASSLGGAALGFAVTEFSDDVLQALHLEKRR